MNLAKNGLETINGMFLHFQKLILDVSEYNPSAPQKNPSILQILKQTQI